MSKLKRYDDYKESGIEWVGPIPAGWEIRPLFAVARANTATNEAGAESNLLSLSYGRIVRKDIAGNDGLLPASFDTYQVIGRNDIVLRLTDLQNDKRSLRSAISPERGIITSAYLALTPTTISPGFLSYLLRAYDLQKVFYSMGGGLRQSMKFSDMKWLPVILPPETTQREVIAYLDRETAQIDELVGKQERLIQMLAEKRQAIITHAVTKGLDPTAPTKPSGIPWLGDIPAHWTPSQLGTWLVHKIEGGYSPIASSIFPEEEDWGVLALGAVGRDEFFPENVKAVDPSADVPKSLEIRHGDLLLTRSNVRERVGFAAVVERPRPRTIFPDLVYRLALSSSIDKHYLACFLSSSPARAQVESSARGSSGTMPKISHDQIRAWRIPLPSLSEQKEIAEFVRSQCDRIDDITVGASTAIELLRERRSALISAAVTGKIDVREGAE
ncbi:restriction endonuclease subunit S [Paenarthrobacter sp. A20]|uniref:restriction endonuclease subunit S n=1 Tax=Paenarthrobacter sp. A20 TaxID=2817891 RepID=UPI00209CDCFD|nr:restriction endonuclease subunit S [Paenarthrobacter sp. A20]MCP1412913.1 type I restriction enzyme S subunit [Paenarthrobacter sp. A20]